MFQKSAAQYSKSGGAVHGSMFQKSAAQYSNSGGAVRGCHEPLNKGRGKCG